MPAYPDAPTTPLDHLNSAEVCGLLLPGERALPIAEARRYWITSMGRVISTCRETPIVLKQHDNTRGYLQVTLGLLPDEQEVLGRQSWHPTVASLVLSAFVGPRPPGYHACHHDDRKLDNRLVNLRWDTPENNYAERARRERIKPRRRASRPARAKYPPCAVFEARVRIAAGEEKARVVAEHVARYGVCRGVVYISIKGERARRTVPHPEDVTCAASAASLLGTTREAVEDLLGMLEERY